VLPVEPFLRGMPGASSKVDTVSKNFQRMLASFVRRVNDDKVDNLVPYFTSKLRDLIPKRYNGDLRDQVRVLLHRPNHQPLHQLFTLAAYFFSNNMLAND
jgi:hypothetical protein